MKINSFGNDFVIQNNDIEKLSNQKKKGAGYPNLDQVPFSVGVGPSNRSRGIPYFCTQGNPTSYFTESRQTTAPTNPVVYYNFEGSFENAAISRGSATGLAVNQAALSEVKKVRGAYSLVLPDATDDYLNLENAVSSVQNLENGSITFWVNFIFTGQRMFFHAQDQTDGDDSRLELFIDTNLNPDTLNYAVYEGGSEILQLSGEIDPAISQNTWYHVAVTAGSGGTKIYIDGVEIASSEVRAFFFDVNDVDLIRIGVDGAGNDDFAGYFDEFAIWDVELNAEIVASIASADPPDLNLAAESVPAEFVDRNGPYKIFD